MNSPLGHLLPDAVKCIHGRISTSPLAARIVTGSFWVLTGTLALRFSRLIASFFVARAVGKAGFGEFGIIQSTIGLFGALAGFGMGVTATKYVAEFHRKDPIRAGRILSLSKLFSTFSGGVMSIALLISAKWIAVHNLAAPHLIEELQIGALFLFLTTLVGAQQGALSGFEAFKSISLVNLAVAIFSLPLIVGGVYWRGVQGAVIGLSASTALNWVLNHLALRRQAQDSGVHFRVKGAWVEWPILWKFSLPAVLSGILVGPVNWYCATLLVNQENGYAQMGAYNAAAQWCIFLTFLPGILGQVVLPILSERTGRGEMRKSMGLVSISVRVNALIVFPLVVVFSLLSRQIMSLYGQDFREEWLLLVVFLVMTGIIAVVNPLGDFLVATGRLWIGFSLNMAWAFIFITVATLLVSAGGVGLASARLIAYVFHGVFSFMVVWAIIRSQ